MNQMKSKIQLCVVIPIYNEGSHVSKVVVEWYQEVLRKTDDFLMLCLDDGSSDDTVEILKKLQLELGERFEYLHHENRGHGQTCIAGYQEACRRQIPYLLQIDSDGQCLPRHFSKFWDQRENFDVICGVRRGRQDGFDRKIISAVLSMSLRLRGSRHPDPNTPYRMMKTENLETLLNQIPSNFYLSNVALSLMLEQSRKSHCFVPIDFPMRNKPKPPMKLSTLIFRAVQLHLQMRGLGR
jgi:dolichol-phosphate mannosyltransferase